MNQINQEFADVALFPIPGCVCFPSSTMPLHIFEPRYRAMIKDCARLGRRIGVSHTVKEISSARKNQTKAEILNSNQTTYEAQKIFSAGFVEIEDVTADGRMAVKIMMDTRYESVEEIQTLPYRIDRCRIYQDQKSPDNEQANLKSKVLQLLRAKFDTGSAELRAIFDPANWAAYTTEEFSFRIFSVVRLETELSQAILEMRTASTRLNSLICILDRNDIAPGV